MFSQKAAVAKGDTQMDRIAVVDAGMCRPTKCGQECKKVCKLVLCLLQRSLLAVRAVLSRGATRQGMHHHCQDGVGRRAAVHRLRCLVSSFRTAQRVDFHSFHVARSTRRCPFGAISVFNLPKGMNQHTSHRYGENAFKLHRCGRVFCATASHRESRVVAGWRCRAQGRCWACSASTALASRPC